MNYKFTAVCVLCPSGRVPVNYKFTAVCVLCPGRSQ